MGDAVGKRVGLARAGSRDDEQRPRARLAIAEGDRLALCLVERRRIRAHQVLTHSSAENSITATDSSAGIGSTRTGSSHSGQIRILPAGERASSTREGSTGA